QRRVVFQVRTIYQTPKEKLAKVPAMVKSIIDAKEQARFDRGHLSTFGEFSYTFEFVYYVASADYNIYMDIQQSINFDIIEGFEKEGIAFAYPMQSLLVQHKNENGAEKSESHLR